VVVSAMERDTGAVVGPPHVLTVPLPGVPWVGSPPAFGFTTLEGHSSTEAWPSKPQGVSAHDLVVATT
jgi:hypothetical protein